MSPYARTWRATWSRAPLAACLGAALLAAAGRRAGAQDPAPAPRPDDTKPLSALGNSARSLRDSVVALARAQVGRRYVYGGQSPERGFDCSGLVRYVMSSLRVRLPRTARQQATVGAALGRDTRRLLPGDLLTFGEGERGGVSHVGIYVGDGRFIHASSAAGRVVETSLDRPASPLIRRWRGARRIPAIDGRELRLAAGGPRRPR